MSEGPLVHRSEIILHLWGGWALTLGLGVRLGYGLILEHNTWLLHSQLLTVPLLLVVLIVCACTLPRVPGYFATGILGSGSWLLAFGLLPRYGWPRAPLPHWLLWAGLGLLLLALAYRVAKVRRWLVVIRGHGYEWTSNWAQDKPLAARLLAHGALHGLGYPPMHSRR
jgi:hypothetical protein